MTPATAPADGGISISAQEESARASEQEQRDDEQFSERRAAFVMWLREYAYTEDRDWAGLVLACGFAMRRRIPEGDAMTRYAQIDGWPATLRAIAQAMEQKGE